MVYRVYVEKKPEIAHEAKSLLKEANELLSIKGLEDVRIINRYDAENITEELFNYAVKTVFSEPQLDIVSDVIPKAILSISLLGCFSPLTFEMSEARRIPAPAPGFFPLVPQITAAAISSAYFVI